jgi:hypothetical protein
MTGSRQILGQIGEDLRDRGVVGVKKLVDEENFHAYDRKTLRESISSSPRASRWRIS